MRFAGIVSLRGQRVVAVMRMAIAMLLAAMVLTGSVAVLDRRARIVVPKGHAQARRHGG